MQGGISFKRIEIGKIDDYIMFAVLSSDGSEAELFPRLGSCVFIGPKLSDHKLFHYLNSSA